jgi:hypothetical protein
MKYTIEFLSAKRNITDAPADDFLARCFSSEDGKATLRQYLTDLNSNSQLSSLPSAYSQEPLLLNAIELPAWASTKLMKQGNEFFLRHAPLILNMLGLLSLPYCYAAADGARVLYLSERLRNGTAKRLRETGEFVWDVMAPNAFAPDGTGFASILKTRLMHAMARYYTLQNSQWQAAWGQPVNQEDMAGTNLSFSLLVIRGLRKLDVAVSYDDQQAFMHLWNVIGYMLGVDESLLPNDGKQAIELEQAISLRQIRPSVEGQALTRALTDYFTGLNLQSPFGTSEVVQLMRFLLGNEIADVIALPQGKAPTAIINLLKVAGTLQELKMIPSANRAYRQQYQDYKKQQQGLKRS